MPIFTWDASYSVGFNEFDDHHKHLFDLINQLYDAMKLGKGNQELGVIVNNLLEYTNFHFSSEEARFTQYAYPEATKHKAEHKIFKDKVLDFKNKAVVGQIGLTVQVASFLKDWLLNHIKVEDRKYGPFLKAKGL
jgi:hemerythrin